MSLQNGSDARVAGVTACQESGAGGAAYGAVGVPIGETDTVGGEAVKVRRSEIGCTHARQIAVALVVSHEDDDVGALVRIGCHGSPRLWTHLIPPVLRVNQPALEGNNNCPDARRGRDWKRRAGAPKRRVRKTGGIDRLIGAGLKPAPTNASPSVREGD